MACCGITIFVQSRFCWSNCFQKKNIASAREPIRLPACFTSQLKLLQNLGDVFDF